MNCRESLLYLDEVCGWAHSSVEATGALFMDQYQANYQHFKAMHLDTCRCRDAFAEKLLGPSTAADDPMSLAQCNSQQLVTCPGTESGFKISYRSIRLAQHHFDASLSRTSPPVFVQKPKPQVVAHIRECLGCMSF